MKVKRSRERGTERWRMEGWRASESGLFSGCCLAGRLVDDIEKRGVKNDVVEGRGNI